MLPFPSQIRAIVFDVANTLLWKPALYPLLDEGLKQITSWRGSVNDLQRVHRIASEVTEIPPRPDRTFYDGFNARWLQVLGIAPSKEVLDLTFQVARSSPWQPFDDVIAIERIALPMGVLSNWDSGLPGVLDRLLPFARRLDFVLASESLGIAKPDSRAFAAAVQKVGMDAEQILYVGDSVRLDVFPAAAAGMATLLIDRHQFYPFYDGAKVTSFHELGDLLCRG